MDKTTLIEQKKEQFIENFNTYRHFKDVININHLADLQEMADLFVQDAQNAMQEGRLLRIGIIGQIKRGKSSFLNSLLFDGREILPKAATPMTAALTKISYSSNAEAVIEFYSAAEWKKIKRTADSVIARQGEYEQEMAGYNNKKGGNRGHQPPPVPPEFSTDEKACLELIKMVRNYNIDVEKYLGKTHKIENIHKNEDLVRELEEFVGAEGKFTPIVKSSELKLNVESLKDIEIVDTPGMNDPVHSRSIRAKEFIGQCDVVFFLSYCSQFLDTHDMGLLAQNIPDKGVSEIFLIGSVFDSALIDCYLDYESIEDALRALVMKLSKQAENNIDSIRNLFGSHGEYIFKTLKKALPPIFISARCHELARKDKILDEEELHTLNLMNNMYENFTFNRKWFELIGNFRAVYEKLKNVKIKKAEIINKKFEDVIRGYENSKNAKLRAIAKDIDLKRQALMDGDIEKISERQEKTIKNIQNGKIKVHSVFEKYAIRAEKDLKLLKSDISAASLSAKRIRSKTGEEQESYEESYQVSDSSWYNPFSWGRTRTKYRTCYRTINYVYADIQDAILQLEKFVTDTNSQICHAVAEIINIEQFRNDIKKAVKDLFDFGDENFDPDAILIPLGNVLERITIPTVSLDLEHHINKVRNAFADSEIRGDDLKKLHDEQDRTVSLILKDISNEIDAAAVNISRKFEKESNQFIPTLTSDLREKVETLRKDLTKKKKALQRYDEVLRKIRQER